MTYLAQEHQVTSSDGRSESRSEIQEELCIRMTNTMIQKNFSKSSLTNEPAMTSVSAKDLFERTVKNKGEHNSVKTRFVDDSTMEVEGLSKMALHSYLLEAEKLGKKIEFVKTTTIKICN